MRHNSGCKPEENTPLGRHGLRQKDNTKRDVTKLLKGMDWIHLADDSLMRLSQSLADYLAHFHVPHRGSPCAIGVRQSPR